MNNHCRITNNRREVLSKRKEYEMNVTHPELALIGSRGSSCGATYGNALLNRMV